MHRFFLRQHGAAFLLQYSDKVSLQQRKVLSAITRCRTGELGSVIFACDGCGRQHWVGRSCGNRHCPVLRLDGVELSDHTRSCEMAGVAVSRLDVLAGQRRGSAA